MLVRAMALEKRASLEWPLDQRITLIVLVPCLLGIAGER